MAAPPPSALDLASENLLETYVWLAQQVPGTTLEQHRDCTLVRGPSGLGFCNYAAGFQGVEDPLALAARLAQVAVDASVFWVFTVPSDPPMMTDALLRSGFVSRYRLQIMVRPPQAPADRIDLTHTFATGEEEIGEIADFMAQEFYRDGQSPSKRAVAHATRHAGYPLAILRDFKPFSSRSWVVAAALLSSPTDNVTGIYNVCVRHSLRGRGVGSKLLEELVNTVGSHQLLTLQCNPQLASWYARFGFESIGEMEGFSVPALLSRDHLPTI